MAPIKTLRSIERLMNAHILETSTIEGQDVCQPLANLAQYGAEQV